MTEPTEMTPPASSSSTTVMTAPAAAVISVVPEVRALNAEPTLPPTLREPV